MVLLVNIKKFLQICDLLLQLLLSTLLSLGQLIGLQLACRLLSQVVVGKSIRWCARCLRQIVLIVVCHQEFLLKLAFGAAGLQLD